MSGRHVLSCGAEIVICSDDSLYLLDPSDNDKCPVASAAELRDLLNTHLLGSDRDRDSNPGAATNRAASDSLSSDGGQRLTGGAETAGPRASLDDQIKLAKLRKLEAEATLAERRLNPGNTIGGHSWAAPFTTPPAGGTFL